jgi:plasmid stabilization system protein ParE
VNWNVTIRLKAKAVLRRAHDWYEERCAGLGDEFIADHAEALLRLEADPERFPLITVVSTRPYPPLSYKIFFRIVGREIIIVRILHGAQDHPRELRR